MTRWSWHSFRWLQVILTFIKMSSTGAMRISYSCRWGGFLPENDASFSSAFSWLFSWSFALLFACTRRRFCFLRWSSWAPRSGNARPSHLVRLSGLSLSLSSSSSRRDTCPHTHENGHRNKRSTTTKHPFQCILLRESPLMTAIETCKCLGISFSENHVTKLYIDFKIMTGVVKNTQEIKKTLFTWTKQGQTCIFSKKVPFFKLCTT